MGNQAVPSDWYRNSFSPDLPAIFWDEDVRAKVDVVLGMLQGTGRERVLDLACATGSYTVELSRRGFEVTGVEARSDLLEIADGEADINDLDPYFHQLDPREMPFRQEFDWALSLGGGAFGHFDFDDEDLTAFEATARALRPGGKLLLQLPNVCHVQAHLTPRTWISTKETVDLIEQYWNAGTRRIEANALTLVKVGYGDLENGGEASFQRRLYSIEELAEIFEAIGLYLADVFDEHGNRCAPTDAQQEVFVEARV
jgi:SAM-dependent methyltransferase